MEWLLAGVALAIVAIFIFGAVRSERAARSAPRPGRTRADGGAAISTGVIVGGVAAAGADESDRDAHGNDAGADAGDSGGGWGGGDGGGGGGGDGGTGS